MRWNDIGLPPPPFPLLSSSPLFSEPQTFLPFIWPTTCSDTRKAHSYPNIKPPQPQTAIPMIVPTALKGHSHAWLNLFGYKYSFPHKPSLVPSPFQVQSHAQLEAIPITDLLIHWKAIPHRINMSAPNTIQSSSQSDLSSSTIGLACNWAVVKE